MVKETFARNKPALSTIPPPQIHSISIVFVSTETAITTLTIEINGTVDVSWYCLIYATPALSAGVTAAKKSSYRFIRAAQAVVSPSTINLASEYNNYFGPQAAGGKAFFTFLFVDTLSGNVYDKGHQPKVIT